MMSYIELRQEAGKEIQAQNLQAIIKMNEDIFHNVSLDEGKWQQCDMKKICENISTWRIPESFWLNGNYYPQIIKEISPIYFPKLKTLSLSGNDIDTVEDLYKLNAINIKYLYLYNNLITNAKSLRKIYLPNLTNLKLQDNPISNIQVMFSTNFRSLKCLSLENNDQQTEMGVSLRWILVSNIGKLSNIYYRKNKRIEQGSIEKKIKQKYKQKLQKFIYVPHFGNND